MLSRICMKKPDVLGNDDTTAWYTELERHHMGEFSMAAYQANSIMEDYSQVEVGDNSLFVGIYDGHNGTNAANFISNHIFQELSRLIRENNNVMRDELLHEAVAATEQKFTHVVIDSEETNPYITYVGSCCLIALIWKGTLYIANLGDSRVVLGKIDIYGGMIMRGLHGVQLTREQNCVDIQRNYAWVRWCTVVRKQNPDHGKIHLKDENGWKVKDLSKVTGSIGDVYLKTYMQKFRTPGPYLSILTSKPMIKSSILRYGDEFLILASRGFWEIMTNEEAVSIVQRGFRRGIAKILLRKALEKVAEKQRMSYKDIVRSADRNKFHDDITIIVVFLDIYRPLWKRNVPKLSYKAPSHT